MFRMYLELSKGVGVMYVFDPPSLTDQYLKKKFDVDKKISGQFGKDSKMTKNW